MQGNCWSLLHYVCSYESKFDAAKLLLARGAEINMQDRYVPEGKLSSQRIYSCKYRYGQTPLHIASLRGHKNLVLLLLSLNADVNLRDQFGEEVCILHKYISNQTFFFVLLYQIQIVGG